MEAEKIELQGPTNKALHEAAEKILIENDLGGYSVPNRDVYPFQWNWDSAFVALGYAQFNLDRAWQELETLFKGQWDDGFLPQIIFWKDNAGYFPGPEIWQTNQQPRTSGISQPPVVATILRQLWEQNQNAEAEEKVKQLIPQVFALHRWFASFRDPLKKGLVVTTHPWETGRDNAPEWDEAAKRVDTSNVTPYVRQDTKHLDKKMRPHKEDYDRFIAMVEFGRDAGWDHKKIIEESPFRVADVGMTMMLLRANRDLLVLAEQFGFEGEAEFLKNQVSLSETGVDYLWNEEKQAFCSRDVISGESTGIISSASFLNFYADVGTAAQRAATEAHIDRIAKVSQFLMPSLAPGEKQFDAMRYWRGPIWAVVNFMIATGCAEQGLETWADKIRNDTAALIKIAGFSEAFNPESGEGTGGTDFSWTAAMWLHWAGK
ncbi:MGH1-like glycoside hydrolase domain-containing protein [Kordiimonas laminariae]|uniref:MGH1-like glycoside hydrolase domain-containing protein n=1 Tax=Kordiimonas laminariae TaxID=2917717 RepID=UPI001FF6DE54|nr:trehalase family glycosidase [Kordiimonas laminariae]MCK0068480.1 hypothetical protein [Kordiimonas laminariae]